MTTASSVMPKPADAAADGDYHTVITQLTKAIAELTARVTQLELSPAQWMPLKTAASLAGIQYETARLWAKAGLIEARLEGKRWLVNVVSLKSRKRLFAQ